MQIYSGNIIFFLIVTSTIRKKISYCKNAVENIFLKNFQTKLIIENLKRLKGINIDIRWKLTAQIDVTFIFIN